jgi:hypothetical protein
MLPKVTSSAYREATARADLLERQYSEVVSWVEGDGEPPRSWNQIMKRHEAERKEAAK